MRQARFVNTVDPQGDHARRRSKNPACAPQVLLLDTQSERFALRDCGHAIRVRHLRESRGAVATTFLAH
jgi:hypothetical protein